MASGKRHALRFSRPLIVRALPLAHARGVVSLGPLRFPCALGRAGLASRKREQDGATPMGCFAIRQVFYRADRLRHPPGRLPTRPLRPNDGWCDEPSDRNYNRFVVHPYPASAERLWREDALYDLVAVLDYNDRPRVRGRGSAIFLHVAQPGYMPTAACIALSRPDLERLLLRLRPGDRVCVGASGRSDQGRPIASATKQRSPKR